MVEEEAGVDKSIVEMMNKSLLCLQRYTGAIIIIVEALSINVTSYWR